MAQVVPLFFVEEKHAIVCQTDFVGCGIGATSHQCHGTNIRLCGGNKNTIEVGHM